MKTIHRLFVSKMSLLIFLMFLPLFLWGSSMADCALSGGSQEVSHSHLPDLSNCVYFYKVQDYIFGFRVGDFAIVQVVRPCVD